MNRKMIPNQRHLFDIPDDIAYFNCGYMSPLLNRVAEIGQQATLRKAHPWEIAPADFFDVTEVARARFGSLINADASDIAIVPAASYGIAQAANNVTVRSGQNLIMLAEQFPSNVYSWQGLATENNGKMVTVERSDNHSWTEGVLDAINDDTALVALPNCHWTDGSLVDLVAVGRRCREVGAKLVLDLTQSVGALPFDVKEVQPDFMVAAGYKWLLSPYSIGFLYVSPENQNGKPIEHSWLTRLGSENFGGLVEYEEHFQPGARRYDVGETPNFALMPMAVAALDQLLNWGVDNIQTTLSAFTDTVTARTAELGLRAGSRSLRAGHFLGLRFPGGMPDDLLPQLAAENVWVSVRGDSMRVTPHLFNNDSDIDKLIDVLTKILK